MTSFEAKTEEGQNAQLFIKLSALLGLESNSDLYTCIDWNRITGSFD